MNPLEPKQKYDRHWPTYSGSRAATTWEQLRQGGGADYSDESLRKENLEDDYQQLFVTMVLDHVQHVVDCVRRKEQPEPMRLLLLGTAGAGKTRAVQTLLQEVKRALRKAHLPAEIDPESFVRVGAPTGTAAFNVRFNATTIHRLIHWFTPPYFASVTNDERLLALQKHLGKTRLLIIDELSMVGRQMMGRIDDRFNQGRAGQNEAGYSLGGVSCVGVGAPAQCEAILDQQIYDVTCHSRTHLEPERPAVQLSNQGLDIYANFPHVIILTKAHRLIKIEDPRSDEDHAFNERADRFVQVLRRLRDLEWTTADYYWLCKRKRSQLSYAERALFQDAPVIMDFRKATDDNPEENCEFYNKSFLRGMARRDGVPIVRIAAQHDGIAQDKGMKLPEERFSGLPSELELAEEARVILIHNLAVEHGLMNGTRGVLKEIVYAPGAHPNHEEYLQRMPTALVVDFPQYAGPRFYDDPGKKTWVPLYPSERSDDAQQGVTRRQFPVVLGWALTPWKAQGMTLDRAIVRLTKAASSPGVAFVALSRVRHPDHLMLEDNFPDMATIMKQSDRDSFRARQSWERAMRVRFSTTLRMHMRDPCLYSAENCWTEAQSQAADVFLQACRQFPDESDEDLLKRVPRGLPATERILYEGVWAKMQTFPHIFEVAAARGRLAEYDLQGRPRAVREHALTTLSYQRWNVPLRDLDAFLDKGVMSESVWEFLGKVWRAQLPQSVLVHRPHVLRQGKVSGDNLPPGLCPRREVFPYCSKSKLWGFFVVTRDESQCCLRAFLPEGGPPEAFEWAKKHMESSFGVSCASSSWQSSGGHDLFVLLELFGMLDCPGLGFEADRELILQRTTRVLRSVREAVVADGRAELEEALDARPPLQKDFSTLFENAPSRKAGSAESPPHAEPAPKHVGRQADGSSVHGVMPPASVHPPSSSQRRGLLASAAERRVREGMERGIGDSDVVNKRRRLAEANAASAAQASPALARAERLRRAFAKARSSVAPAERGSLPGPVLPKKENAPAASPRPQDAPSPGGSEPAPVSDELLNEHAAKRIRFSEGTVHKNESGENAVAPDGETAGSNVIPVEGLTCSSARGLPEGLPGVTGLSAPVTPKSVPESVAPLPGAVHRAACGTLSHPTGAGGVEVGPVPPPVPVTQGTSPAACEADVAQAGASDGSGGSNARESEAALRAVGLPVPAPAFPRPVGLPVSDSSGSAASSSVPIFDLGRSSRCSRCDSTQHATVDCPHFSEGRDPSNLGHAPLPHLGETQVQFLGRTHDGTRVLRVNGEDYIVGSASGADNNCLIDTLRQKLGNFPVSLAAVRDDLAAQFPDGEHRVNRSDAGNYLDLRPHWAAVVRSLGLRSGRRFNPDSLTVVCVDLDTHEGNGDAVGSGRMRLFIALERGNHFVPLLRYHGAAGPLPHPWKASRS